MTKLKNIYIHLLATEPGDDSAYLGKSKIFDVNN